MRNKRPQKHHDDSSVHYYGYRVQSAWWSGTGKYLFVDGYFRVAYGDCYKFIVAKNSKAYYGEASIKVEIEE